MRKIVRVEVTMALYKLEDKKAPWIHSPDWGKLSRPSSHVGVKLRRRPITTFGVDGRIPFTRIMWVVVWWRRP